MINKKILLSLAACAAATNLYAVEGGTSNYVHGVENFLSGAVPPPGLHAVIYGGHYSADRLNDKNGDNLNVPDFNVSLNAVVPRLVWVTDQKFLGGDVLFETLLPLVDLDVKAAGKHDSKQGVGDLMLGAGLAFHHSPHLHSATALDVYLPTGDYNKNDLANIGHNRTSVNAVYAVSYLNDKTFNASIRFGYMYNGKNDDTNYHNGDQFHFDYAIGKNITSNFTAGIGGYFLQQLSDDKQNGVNMGKTNGFSIGPSFKYQTKKWFATLKWEKELIAENKTQGNAVWFKIGIPNLL